MSHLPHAAIPSARLALAGAPVKRADRRLWSERLGLHCLYSSLDVQLLTLAKTRSYNSTKARHAVSSAGSAPITLKARVEVCALILRLGWGTSWNLEG